MICMKCQAPFSEEIRKNTERERDTLLEGDNSVKIILFSSWKGVYSKRKEFAPLNRFGAFSVDPLSEGAWWVEQQTWGHKSCHPCKTKQKIYHAYPVPLIRHLLIFKSDTVKCKKLLYLEQDFRKTLIWKSTQIKETWLTA